MPAFSSKIDGPPRRQNYIYSTIFSLPLASFLLFLQKKKYIIAFNLSKTWYRLFICFFFSNTFLGHINAKEGPQGNNLLISKSYYNQELVQCSNLYIKDISNCLILICLFLHYICIYLFNDGSNKDI